MSTQSAPHRRSLVLGALVLAAAPALTSAASYPDHPITLIVPFPAGGTVDATARLASAEISKRLKTPVIIENIGGAGGVIASQRVARAAPDGYTLLFATPNHTINPVIQSKLPFDTERDFEPVSLVAQIPELLVANGQQPFSDLKGFIDYARSHPGQLNYGSAGNGTLPHVTMELLLLELGLKVTHVPYKGAAPAMNDLLSGQVAIKMDTITTSQPHIPSGRLKPLALASLQRSPLMPDVPTIAESGLPGYQGILWMGILAPKGTPKPIIDTLHRAIADAVKNPELGQNFQAGGAEPITNTPAEFRQMISSEITQWKDMIKRDNITVN
ncbi:ABC transporter substrate-binding protein [Bordetella tumbae]|uniref:Bug family tripartite tricarboxylate transporter substrate binding protein n=1 Tax=Bordetella tumbae TaxID=1649139 RepID=UPI0039EF0F9B